MSDRHKHAWRLGDNWKIMVDNQLPAILKQLAPPQDLDSDSQTLKVWLARISEALNSDLEGSATRSDRATRGQFVTPPSAAELLADMAGAPLIDRPTRVLDAGAGAGALTLALVAQWIESGTTANVHVDMVEKDPNAEQLLHQAAEACVVAADATSLDLSIEVRIGDFLTPSTWRSEDTPYDIAIMNPPYMKLPRDDPARLAARIEARADVPNLYAAFVIVAAELLAENGRLVAITPRSFTNGRYFRSFREALLAGRRLVHVVSFDHRGRIFDSSDVLQENVIFRLDEMAVASEDSVVIETHTDHESGAHQAHRLPHDEVVDPDDPQLFVNLPSSPEAAELAREIAHQPLTLEDADLSVSTGHVVDFRMRDSLRATLEPGAIPLIYPANLEDGLVSWPVSTKKPQALVLGPETQRVVMPNGHYVVLKRFTSKEEARRVVASVYEPIPGHSFVAFENHLNIYHRDRGPIAPDEAESLANYLNSTLVDTYFRTFSGSTQVNATDLRRLRLPLLTTTSEDDQREPETRSHANLLLFDEELVS